MANYYFVRHGEARIEEAYTKIYQDWGFNMLTLSEKGIEQIKETSKDERLKEAQIIITSPFGRALHSAAILSKELGVDLMVETDLHEWIPDSDYQFLCDEDALGSFKEFYINKGIKNDNCKYNFETLEHLKNRINNVLKKYQNYDTVIVVCHGVIMQCLLGMNDLKNGQIGEYEL